MFKNYLKTTLRNVWKNKTFSFLNIFGLTIGITCAACIFLWVEDELAFDSVNLKKDVLYQVYQNQLSDGKTFTINATPGPLAEGIKREIPGIKNTCRTTWSQSLSLEYGEKKIKQEGIYADSAIFNMFTLPFVEGNPQQPFRGANSLVLTVSTVERLFGKRSDYMGQIIKAGNENFVVTGVMKDLPQNSTLQCDWIAPFEVHFQRNQWLSNWQYNGAQCFVELEASVNVASVNQKLGPYTAQKTTKRAGTPFLLGMNDWRLRSGFEDGKATGGRIAYVKLFSIIACIILLIACINFMNLATARSATRAKEIGIRKAIGAKRSGLIKQFLFETIFLSLISVSIAMVLLLAILPAFNILVQKNLTLGLFQPMHFIPMLATGLICGILAGSYPSFYLSSFNPVKALKGVKVKEGNTVFIRKGLVVLQFATSVVFIIGTIVVYQQIQHVKTRPLGYQKNNLLQIELSDGIKKNYAALKQDLISTGKIKHVGQSMLNVLYMGSTTSEFSWQGKNPKDQVILGQNWVNADYVPALGVTIQQGRNFYESANDSTSVMVNETLAKLVDQKGDAVGKQVTRGNKTFTIVGILSDIIYGDMYSSGSPMIFLCNPQRFNYLYVRLENKDINRTLADLQSVIKKYDPDYTGEYSFVDSEFNQLFQTEMLTAKFSKIFALLAIIISCMGLFALAAYTAELRTKEIGVRKVLGASVNNIIGMLTKEFLKLVFISSLIAIPTGWWVMNKWLEDFSYRIEINWVIFPVAGVAAMLIAIITVSFQAVRAALANPVKSLRTE